MVLKKYFGKERVMTKEEFMTYYNRKYGSKELHLNKRLATIITFVFANLIWINNAYASNMDKLDNLGFTVLDIVRSFGYWIFLILCLIEIIKTLMNGDTKSIARIIIKYLIGFGALHFMPFLFDVVKEACQ